MRRSPFALGLALATLHGVLGCSSASEPPPRPPVGDPAVSAAPEAGFVDVPPQASGQSSAARLFYAFQPAVGASAGPRPLFVLFNGGPGSPTSLGLFAYGTGARSLSEDGPATPQPNPHAWTRFGHLLYVDERHAGFSYGLGPPVPPDQPLPFDEVDDAVDFVQVLLRFLEAHPALQRAPVVLVGESYGGARAARMLDLLLHYRTRAPGPLGEEVQRHLDRAMDARGAELPPERIAAQFGAMVLIQPVVVGDLQIGRMAEVRAKDAVFADPDRYDGYHAGRPRGWSEALTARARGAMLDPGSLEAWLGVPLTSVPALWPEGRRGAFRAFFAQFERAGEPDLTARLGALPQGDRYFVTAVPLTHAPFDTRLGDRFLANLRYARAFITNARMDPVVRSEVVFGLMTESKIPVERRGEDVAVTLAKQDALPEKTVLVRFPSYEASGHMVSVTEPEKLARDVATWVAEGR